MQVICSYCRKNMGEKEPYTDGNVSHSMCPDCFDYFMEQINGLSLDEFLEKFETPVLIVDGNGRAVAANIKAEVMTGRSLKDIIGLLGGEIMECVYARLPEGCGKTAHCSACTIRNTVMSTMESGESRMHTPVKLLRDSGEVSMIISTEKIGSMVRIVIEAAGPSESIITHSEPAGVKT